MKGVTEKEFEILRDILMPYQREYRFECYGSRVKGGFEKTSDLDVLITGKGIVPYDVLEKLKQRCDNSDLPYIVNFCDRAKIDEKFYDGIENDLTQIL